MTDTVSGSMHWLVEVNRLNSFRNWPLKGKRRLKASPENLAKAGFYHIPTEDAQDLCKCAYCGKELDGWEASDDPLEEHKTHQPDCMYMNLDKEEERLKTFQDLWDATDKPTAQALAHAGLFFFPLVDSTDNVKCFRCGKELDGWEENDNPIEEHARGTKCKFLASLKKRKAATESESAPAAKKSKRTLTRKKALGERNSGDDELETKGTEHQELSPVVAPTTSKRKGIARKSIKVPAKEKIRKGTSKRSGAKETAEELDRTPVKLATDVSIDVPTSTPLRVDDPKSSRMDDEVMSEVEDAKAAAVSVADQHPADVAPQEGDILPATPVAMDEDAHPTANESLTAAAECQKVNQQEVVTSPADGVAGPTETTVDTAPITDGVATCVEEDVVVNRLQKADPSMTIEEFHNNECEHAVSEVVNKAEAMIAQFIEAAKEKRAQLEQLAF